MVKTKDDRPAPLSDADLRALRIDANASDWRLLPLGMTKRLLATIAARDETVAELSQTYIDETGLCWSAPSAWAYAQACKTIAALLLARDAATIERCAKRIDELEDCSAAYIAERVRELTLEPK